MVASNAYIIFITNRQNLGINQTSKSHLSYQQLPQIPLENTKEPQNQKTTLLTNEIITSKISASSSIVDKEEKQGTSKSKITIWSSFRGKYFWIARTVLSAHKNTNSKLSEPFHWWK